MNQLEEARPKEAQEPTALRRLAILVHPLWHIDGNLDNDRGNAYKHDVSIMYSSERLARLAPNADNEALLIMPDSPGMNRLTLCRILAYYASLRETKPHERWTDLYSRIRKSSPIKRNVRLVDNIGRDSRPADVVLERLKQFNFAIDESTEIVLGGENTEQCVRLVAEKILALPIVSTIKIDTAVSRYYDGWSSFGFEQMDGQGHIVLKKKPA